MSQPIEIPILSDDERMRLYGYREVPRSLAGGETVYDRVALTLDDLLHPQMGDVAMESSVHDQEKHYLASVFRSQLDDKPDALVLSDCCVTWDNPELRHHSPDVAVIFNVREQRNNWSNFQVREQRTRPTLIVEVVSPDYRENDTVKKAAQYYRAGVLWYIIVDRREADDPPQLIVRRYQTHGWETVEANDNSRYWLPKVRVWIGVANNRVACFDGETGEMLGDYSAVRRELADIRSKLEHSEIQMEAEIEARREAIALANAESVRADTETMRADTEMMRANTETMRANTETELRRGLEARLAALEAELLQARGAT